MSFGVTIFGIPFTPPSSLSEDDIKRAIVGGRVCDIIRKINSEKFGLFPSLLCHVVLSSYTFYDCYKKFNIPQ